MADVVKQQPAQPPAADQAAQDLAVINPNVTITLAGEQITVTEYPFFTWINLKPRSEALRIDLSFLLDTKEATFTEDVLEVFEENIADVKFLVSQSINKPEEFIQALSNQDIETLLLTWWTVNKHFFMKSAGRLMRQRKRLASHRAGQTSSSALSNPDTTASN